MKRMLLLLSAGMLIVAVQAIGQSRTDYGKELLKQGKTAEAINFFQGLLQNTSRDADAWFWLAKSYQKIGRLDSAEIAAQRVVRLNDELMDGWQLLSEIQVEQKNLVGAFATVKAGLKVKKQENPALLVQLGHILMLSDSADAALVAFTRAKELDPSSVSAYIGMGDAYLKQGVGPMATVQFEKALEIDSLQPALLYRLATIYLKERQYNESGHAYNRLLALQPNNDNARLELANLYKRAKLWAKCAGTLKDYFVRNPNPPKDVMLMYMEALYQSKQYKEALPVAEKYVAADAASPLATRILAVAQVEQKQYAKGVETYAKLTAMDSLGFDDYRRLGRAYRETNKDSLAALTLERALKLDTTQAALYGEVGSIWMKLKNWDRAAEMFAHRFRLDTLAVGALVNYGSCMMQLEDYEKASGAFERVIKINPQYPPAYIRLASCYFQQKKATEGRQAAEKAIQAVDTAKVKYRLELADAYRMVGLSFLLEKKWDEGVKSLRESLKYKDDEAQTWLLLGQGLQNMQKNKEAFEAYKHVLKLDPKNEQAKKGVDTLAPIVGE